MTVYELGDERARRRRRPGVPARRASRRRPDPARLRLSRATRAIRAVVLTHAHEDHVGALPYLMREVRVPRDLGDAPDARARQVEARRARPAARDRAEGDRSRGRPGRPRAVPARVRAHGALGAGRGRHRHRDERRPRLPHRRLEARPHAGRRPAHRRRAGSPSSATAASTCCCGDSTNAERPGFTRLRARRRRGVPPDHPARARDASSSRASRRTSTACSRRSTSRSRPAGRSRVVGRSMRRNLNVARNLGYIEVPDGLARPRRRISTTCPPQRAAGRSAPARQGEPLSALTRIAYNDHPAIKVERGDTVIISARPVPGNELRVHDAINRLTRNGAEVLHEENAAVHVSGHARAGGAAHAARPRPPEGGDADPRRVPDAGRARAAGAGGRRAGGVDRDRRERRRRRAVARRASGSPAGSSRASRSSTGSASATSRTSRSATGATCPRTAC